MATGPENLVHNLYAHVPFCAAKCHYCAFYSETPDGALVNRFVSAFCNELSLIAGRCKPRTIFFGGGTPSLLNLKQWEQILETMHRLGLCGATEWTVECNPATVSADKAKLLRSAGVNRISMGVQSLDKSLLDRLGRIHTREMVFKSYNVLRNAGIANINLDLMFAIPGQTKTQWRDSLRETMAMNPEHLSSYEVTYEEDTPLYHQLQAGEFSVDEEMAADMYEILLDEVSNGGFTQYEISNFARRSPADTLATPPALACKHNVNYWRGGTFFAVGPSAAGFVDGVRTKNWSNTQLYCEKLERGERAIETSDELSPLARAAEAAAFGLRMNIGWPFEQFKQVTGFDLREEWADDLRALESKGWGVIEPDRFRLTRSGLRFADAAAELLLRPEVPVTSA